MSGIIQRKSTPSGIALPSAGSVFMGVDTSGVFFTKDESGTVTVYPTEGGTFTGGTVSFLSATTLSSTTLNIDFTDTLDFYSGDSLELGWSETNQAILKGDMIGILYEEGDETIFTGQFDGVIDVFGGFAEFDAKQHISSYKNADTGDSIVQRIGRLKFPAEAGGDDTIGCSPFVAQFNNGDNTWTEYEMSVGKVMDDEEHSFGLKKQVLDPINETEETIEVLMESETTGIEFINNLIDDTASVYAFFNNEGDTILDLRNDNIQSDLLLDRDFADDAAAEAAGVPEGGFYHTAGVLKIRLPLP
jgi:hypothetical protein